MTVGTGLKSAGAAPYDVVVPVGSAHNGVARIALRQLLKLAPCRELLVLTARENFGALQELRRLDPRLRLVDEDTVVPGVTLRSVASCLSRRGANPQRAGWYLQQFLKMGACLLPGIAGHYLLWDADTVMLRPIPFFSGEAVLVNPAAEYHAPYFETYRRLLGATRSASYSFISEHLMVRTPLMQELLRTIGGDPVAGEWVWRILEAIPAEELSSSGFSEYETYGNFVLSRFPGALRARSLPSWRFAARSFGLAPSRCDLFRLSRRYYYASFESWDVADPKELRRQKLLSVLFCLRHALVGGPDPLAGMEGPHAQ